MILALSDTHGLLPDLDISGIDRILLAGDVCPTTDHSGQRQRRWLERNFSAWIEHLKLPVYLALGNHDFVDDFAAPANLHYGTQRIVDDVLLFSWVPQFFDWAWMAGCGESLLLFSIHKYPRPTKAHALKAGKDSVWLPR